MVVVFQDMINERNIQGVPAGILNGKPLPMVKLTHCQLIEKLQQQYPDLMSGATAAEQLEQQDVNHHRWRDLQAAAAIYVARKGLKATMVADRIGGQVKDTQDIENFDFNLIDPMVMNYLPILSNISPLIVSRLKKW